MSMLNVDLSNNIFISYAHADNRRGWVDGFHTSLENRLGVLGVTARIWRDKKLSGADIFSDEILDQLKQSALFISILSPSAIKSQWCQKERQRFEEYSEMRGGFRVGNLVRALKVVMTPAEGDVHRGIFGTLGYEFFQLNNHTGRFDHYNPSDPQFESLIDQLAQEIREIMPMLATAVSQAAQPAVFVAEVSADLEPDRTKVVDQLSAWGFRVIPPDPLPNQSAKLRASIESGLSDAVLSVHLLSDKRGVIPDEEERSILALQYELASARGLDRIVWVLPGTQPHPMVEEVLQQGSMNGLERLEGQRTIEDVKEILAAKLRTPDELPRRPQRGPKRNIYVVCNNKDHPFSSDAEAAEDALQLKSFLDKLGYCVWLPPANVNHSVEWDKDHRETLKQSDAVILYWGVADEVWFRRTLRELTKVRTTTRRNRPFVAEAIYFSRPPRQEKAQYRTYLDLVVEQFKGFEPEALRPFLDRLHQTGEGATG